MERQTYKWSAIAAKDGHKIAKGEIRSTSMASAIYSLKRRLIVKHKVNQHLLINITNEAGETLFTNYNGKAQSYFTNSIKSNQRFAERKIRMGKYAPRIVEVILGRKFYEIGLRELIQYPYGKRCFSRDPISSSRWISMAENEDRARDLAVGMYVRLYSLKIAASSEDIRTSARYFRNFDDLLTCATECEQDKQSDCNDFS